MTVRESLIAQLQARTRAVIEIPSLARRVFPIGSTVDVIVRDELLSAVVEFHSAGGEEATVNVPGVGRRPYRLAQLLDWNPNAGLVLADVA